jgi:hypothetical protein
LAITSAEYPDNQKEMASIIFKNIVCKSREEKSQEWLWLTLDQTLRD